MASKRTSFFLHEPAGSALLTNATAEQASADNPSVGHANDSRINNFDLIRLFAALLVVISHSVYHTGLYEKLSPGMASFFNALHLIPAVPIFFVVSGFLINASFERDPSNLRGYFWRRGLRIFPALWVAIFISIACLASFGFLSNGFASSSTFLKWLATQFTFLQAWNPEHFRGFGNGVVNGALWTISVELQYYLIVPIWCLLGRKLGGSRFLLEISILLISMTAHLFMRHSFNIAGGFSEAPMAFKALHMTLLPHLWMFMLGVWICRHFNVLSDFVTDRFPIWAALWMISAISGKYIFESIPALSSSLYIVSHILLAFATISFAYTARTLSSKILRGNDMSYGIYIFHCLIINVMLELGFLQTLASVPVVILLAMTLGFLSWKFLEKPVLSLKNWVPMNKKAPIPSAATTA